MESLNINRVSHKFPLIKIDKCQGTTNHEEEVCNFGREKGPKKFCLV